MAKDHSLKTDLHLLRYCIISKQTNDTALPVKLFGIMQPDALSVSGDEAYCAAVARRATPAVPHCFVVLAYRKRCLEPTGKEPTGKDP